MEQATLIYPHQLFSKHPALSKATPVYLIEDPLLFGTDRHQPLKVHRQRLMFHRASMKAYAAELERRGYEVRYVDCPPAGRHDTASLLCETLGKKVKKILVAAPHDFLLEKRLARFVEKRNAELVLKETPAFLSPTEFLEEHTGPDRKRPFMATFYKAQRKRMDIMMDGDDPVGGRWSYDEDNRQKVPKDLELPDEPFTRPNDYVKEAQEYIALLFPDNPGKTDTFAWPVTHRAAQQWMATFFEERFHDFGPYEDALHLEHRTLFHSALSPLINAGLLTPAELVEGALEFAAGHDVPLNSLEGFIRQVIGWREFMCGIYKHRGVEIRTGNYWNHKRDIPEAFYTGQTGIPPLDDAIRHAVNYAWGHHIERLMVIGNFMLLCRFSPDAIYRWFMELYIDAYDWVMVPNVYGMSQFADGGTFTTKPYLSGSNYIRKMSHYPTGDWCATWDGLYWSFIGDHIDFFSANPRLSMMTRSWTRMDFAKQRAHRDNANRFFEQLGID